MLYAVPSTHCLRDNENYHWVQNLIVIHPKFNCDVITTLESVHLEDNVTVLFSFFIL
jgi:hypothetical protein